MKNAYEKWPDKKFIARTPLIPGVNDSEDDIRAVLAFVRPHKNVVKYELLPYHRFGMSKYEFLERNYQLADFQTAPPEVVAKLRAIVDESFSRKDWSEVKGRLRDYGELAQVGESITLHLIVLGLLANFVLHQIATVLFLRTYQRSTDGCGGFSAIGCLRRSRFHASSYGHG